MLKKFPEILIIPIDNRPVCSTLPENVARILKGTKVYMPDNSILGSLAYSADTNKIFDWTSDILLSRDIDIAIISLDTIAYGGLIASRRIKDSFEEIKSRIDKFLSVFKQKHPQIKIYAFSSIMRISNNNCAEEEKSYWENYGEDLFQYSYLSHKLLRHYDVEIEAELIRLAKEIPFEIIEDYLDTRKRNYEINSYYVDLAKNGYFDKLIFSQDDTAEFGFNVEEKDLLRKQALKEQIQDKVVIKTGADEMAVSLLSRALVDYYDENVAIAPMYFDVRAKDIISKYEDVSIANSIEATINLCGAKLVFNKEDISLLVNAPNKIQNDLCMGIYEDDDSTKQSDELVKFWQKTTNKIMIADIKNANGADNHLVENLLTTKYDDEKFYGYAAWNTTGNTLGTVIATAIIKHIALKKDMYSEKAFKKTQQIRFLDDWAYQANVRKILREKGSNSTIKQDMQQFETKVANFLDYNVDTNYGFPWDRTFEIEVID